jgi:predicted ATP-binding protein involved in virulence
MSAINEGNTAEAERIERWFANFTETLQEIYNCPELELRHESKELNYKIVMPGYEPFGLDQMADGYSAFLKIVMELMVRMEQQNDDLYEAPGIAFVDEIETHLHVELQKKVLPFLTRMFPNIQFIVTTHSPFILTSIDNAVVYDLEKHQRQEDLSAYSYEGVIEYYFDIDMYSNEIRTQFEKYKNLLNNSNRTNEENEELAEIISSLNRIPPAAAEELVYAFRELESKRKQG